MTRRDLALDRLLGPTAPELGCDECFDLVDVYVDAELRGEDAAAVIPGMREHLAGCPACAEEYQSLRELAAEERTPR
jgi:anti-sigma factor RsiW